MKSTAVALPVKVGGESTTAGEKKKTGSDDPAFPPDPRRAHSADLSLASLGQYLFK
jgi:hypothetical protein